MNGRKHKSGFWMMTEAYLKQPVFDQKVPISFNPLKFRNGYRIRLLERCWQLDYEIEAFRLRLENCWQKASLESAPAVVLQP